MMKFRKHCYYLFLILVCPLVAFAQGTSWDEVDALIKRGDFKKAETELSQLKVKDPKNPMVHEKLGDLYGARDQWEQALKSYLVLLDIDDNNADYHFKVGGIYGMIALENKLKALGIIDDIKFHFKKAAELDARHLEARWALIELYLELPGFLGGSYKVAYEYADELHDILPVEGYLARGYIDDYRDNPELARESFLMAAKFMDNITATYPRENIHYQFGKIASKYGINRPGGLWHLEQYEQRYNALSRIGLEWIYYHMAMICKGQKRHERALDFLEKSLEVLPEFKPSLKEKKALESL